MSAQTVAIPVDPATAEELPSIQQSARKFCCWVFGSGACDGR